MKNKIAIASAFLAASSFSMGEIVVNEFLSFEGFVDSSYSHTNADEDAGDKSPTTASKSIKLKSAGCSTSTLSLPKSILSMKMRRGDYDDEVEQAFVNYALGNGDVITAGRYASMLGFEAFEPTGLYQYSTAYASCCLGTRSDLTASGISESARCEIHTHIRHYLLRHLASRRSLLVYDASGPPWW